MYVLQSLQLHLSPFQHLIRFLKIGKVLDCFVQQASFSYPKKVHINEIVHSLSVIRRVFRPTDHIICDIIR